MGKNLKSLIMAGTLALASVAMFSGCSTGDRSTGQYIDDRQTSKKIKGALTDNPIYKFEDVQVNTYRGVVQLNGWVEKPEQKQVAENIAKGTAGVMDVVNNLTLKPKFQVLTPTGESQTGRPLSEQQQQQQRQQQQQQTP